MIDQKNFFPLNGSYMLKLASSGKLNFKQIEACRKSIRRSLKKEGNLIMRTFTIFLLLRKHWVLVWEKEKVLILFEFVIYVLDL